MTDTRIEFPADASWIPEMRALAGAMCARVNLTVNAIDDAKHALDEALTIAIGVAPPESRVTCTLNATSMVFRAGVSVPHDEENAVDVTSGLAWRVLCGIAHETKLLREDGRTTVHFALSMDASVT
jgi:hypothetical protein